MRSMMRSALSWVITDYKKDLNLLFTGGLRKESSFEENSNMRKCVWE